VPETEFRKALGLFDSIMIVAGIMVGSGIFIVSAEISRQVGSAGWLLVTWIITGVLTVFGALSYGELAAMIPSAGGMYVYLREAFSPLLGFLYGWTLVTVIQTGSIAAVAIAFARFTGVLFPSISETHYLIAPIRFLPGYAVSLTTTQGLALLIIVVTCAINIGGVRWGKLVQNIFTVAKVNTVLPGIGKLAMACLIMVSTFGTVNALTLAGGRACYAMAQDGLFFRRAGILNNAQVPGWALALQCLWALLLVLPRTYDVATHTYGNLYSNLLDYVISAALIFYILTVAGLFRLRRTRPNAPRPYRCWGYPWLPAIYILGASFVLIILFAFRTATTWPGLLIVLSGVPVYRLLRRSTAATEARANLT
jgi:amino acid transporter